MKYYRAYTTFVVTYCRSAFVVLAFPPMHRSHCRSTHITILAGIRTTRNGQSGRLLPQRRDIGDHQVWHQIEDGQVLDFFDISALKRGVEHAVWDNKGNVYTATKHAITDDNVLTVHLGDHLASEQGHRVVKRAEKLASRADASVDSISASWSYTGSAFDSYGQSDADKDGQRFYYDMFVGENRDQITGPFDCTTLRAPNGDNEKINISLTPQEKGLTTEIEPACGA